MFREKEEALLLVPGCHALSRRTKLTRFNSVETQSTYDAANRLLELHHVLLPIKFVWADPSTWLRAVAVLVHEGLRSMDDGLAGLGGTAAYAAPPTVTPRPAPLGPTTLSQFTYTYDPLGNRLSQTITPPTPGSTQTYGYDPLSQLQTVTGSQTHSYQYDAVGNRQQADGTSYTPNTLNQYSQVGSTSYMYDPNGNLTSDGVNAYAYDAENHLISAAGSFGTASYISDAFGRRIAKTVNGVTTKFTWDGDQLLEELDSTHAQLAEYVNGPGIDEPLRMERATVKTYFLQDGLGSITHLTDKTGKLIEQYTYDPYGKPSIFDGVGNPLTQSAFGNRLLFTGREYDAETGLYFYRARYYSPAVGRFLQRDPLGYFDGPNPYTYVKNNPINLTDPSGTLALVNPAVMLALLLAILVGAVATDPSLQAQFQQLGQLVGEAIAGIAQGAGVVVGQVCQLAGHETDYDPDVHPVFGKIKPGVQQPDPSPQIPGKFGPEQGPGPDAELWLKIGFILAQLTRVIGKFLGNPQ